MDATEIIEALYEGTYAERMKAVMVKLRDACRAYKLDADEVWDMSGDDFSWAFRVKAYPGAPDADTLDVTLKLDEQQAYEGEGDGVTFSLDLVWYGGEIAGGMAPYNYTPSCWVSATDTEAVAERFSYFEQTSLEHELATFILKATTERLAA